jgi:hypothetical protein
MAARKVKPKGTGGGRLRLTLLLVAFLAISGAVVLRRSFGNRGARELSDLEAKRAALIDERLRLENDIRTASSRSHLLPIAEGKLGMHVPVDSVVFNVPHGTAK